MNRNPWMRYKCKECGYIVRSDMDTNTGITSWYCSNSDCKNATNVSESVNRPSWIEEVPID